MNEFLQDFKHTEMFLNILNQIKNNTFSQGSIVLCDDDFSAKIFAKLIAQTLLCVNENACFDCFGCKQVISELHTDLYVFPKGKTFAVLDSNIIVEKSVTKPVNAKRKVFLIYDFDNSTVASQNKILKILEEPTKSTYFVISAKNANKILPTIKSRMQIINFPSFSDEKLAEILKNHGYVTSDFVLGFAEGNLGKAISLLSNDDFKNSYSFVLSCLKEMKGSKDVIKYSVKLANKNTFMLTLEIFEKVFRDLMLLSQNSKLLSNTQISSLQGLENEFSFVAILKIIKKINEAKKFADANVSLQTISDNLLLAILEVKYLWK